MKCGPTMSCPTLAGIEILTSYLMQIRSKLLWIKRWYTSQIEIYWLTLELFLGASGKDRLSSALATSPPEPSNMHVGKSRKDFNVTFFSRRSSSFFRLQAMPSILGYSTYRIQVEPGTRTQHLQHQFGMCIYALPALAFSHCWRSDFGHIRLLCKKAKKRKSDDINLDSSGCFGCTCHYLRLGTSPKSHESAVRQVL